MIRCKKEEYGGILRLFGDEMYCFVSEDTQEDFLKPFIDSGLEIDKERLVILDTTNRKRAKYIILLLEVSNRNQILYKNADFIITSKKPLIGIIGNNYVPIGIYLKEQSGEAIWAAGAIRKDAENQDIFNFRNLFSIFEGMYGERKIKVMIGPTANNTDFILDFLKEINNNNVESIYYCDYVADSGTGIDKFKTKTIFYFIERR